MIKNTIKPVFIFSLPRAGSTLLQRILLSYPEICSASEPWILLPLLNITNKKGTISNYSYINAIKGIEDFIEVLPNQKKTLNNHLRKLIISLYTEASSENSKYFLDKTPRYYLIIDQIKELFPEAKFIFLFRNPIHIYSSILTTWCNNNFKESHNFFIDLKSGFLKLSEGYEKHKKDSISIKYENLIKNPNKEISKVCKYLSIEENNHDINKINLDKSLKGRMGDPTGVLLYKTISDKTTKKWEKTFNTFYRKKILIKYLQSIEKHIFEKQGYNKGKLILDVKKIKTSISFKIIIDFFQYSYAVIVYNVKKHLFSR